MEEDLFKIWEQEHKEFDSKVKEEVTRETFEAYVPNRITEVYLRWMGQNRGQSMVSLLFGSAKYFLSEAKIDYTLRDVLAFWENNRSADFFFKIFLCAAVSRITRAAYGSKPIRMLVQNPEIEEIVSKGNLFLKELEKKERDFKKDIDAVLSALGQGSLQKGSQAILQKIDDLISRAVKEGLPPGIFNDTFGKLSKDFASGALILDSTLQESAEISSARSVRVLIIEKQFFKKTESYN